jgi:hypothetical protein
LEKSRSRLKWKSDLRMQSKFGTTQLNIFYVATHCTSRYECPNKSAEPIYDPLSHTNEKEDNHVLPRATTYHRSKHLRRNNNDVLLLHFTRLQPLSNPPPYRLRGAGYHQMRQDRVTRGRPMIVFIKSHPPGVCKNYPVPPESVFIGKPQSLIAYVGRQ